MKYLLDTHVFLWMALEQERLRPEARRELENGANELFFSAASAWEIAIKARLGRLELPGSAASYVPTRVASYGLKEIPVTIAHGLAVEALPHHHADPFDRLLIVQAQMERLTIITADSAFSAYRVRRLQA